MIDKRKHLYFTKRVEDKFLNMNADVTMNVEADSREVTKVFEKWVKKINEADSPKAEQTDIGLVLEYEIRKESEYQGVRLSFQSYREEKGLDEQTRYEIEKLMNETAIRLNDMLNKKD